MAEMERAFWGAVFGGGQEEGCKCLEKGEGVGEGQYERVGKGVGGEGQVTQGGHNKHSWREGGQEPKESGRYWEWAATI